MRTPARNLNNLWIARKRAGLSQKAVARLLGHRSTSVISEYETGRLVPNLMNAFRLAAIYDWSLPALYPEHMRDAQAYIQSKRKGNSGAPALKIASFL